MASVCCGRLAASEKVSPQATDEVVAERNEKRR